MPGAMTRCLSVLSFALNMAISTAALQGRGGKPGGPRTSQLRACEPAHDCQPVPPRSSRGQSRCAPNQPLFRAPLCGMERIEAAEEAHCSLPRPASTASLPGRLAVTSPHPPPESVGFEMMLPRTSVLHLARGGRKHARSLITSLAPSQRGSSVIMRRYGCLICLVS